MIVLTGTLSLRIHEQDYHIILLHCNDLHTSNNVQQPRQQAPFLSGSRPHSSEGKTDGCLDMSVLSKATVPKNDRTNCLWYSFAPASSIASISASVSLGASNVLRYSTRRDSFVVVLERFVSQSVATLPTMTHVTITTPFSRCHRNST